MSLQPTHQLYQTRHRFHTRIRREARNAEVEIRRQHNIRFLLEFAKTNVQDSYLNYVSELYQNPHNETLITYLLNNLQQLRQLYSISTERNWRQFTFIFQVLFTHHHYNKQLFVECFEIGLRKGIEYLSLNNECYGEYMKVILSFIYEGIEIFLGSISDKAVSMVEEIIRRLFVNFDEEWQSPFMIESGLDLIYLIISLDDRLEIQVNEETVLLKQRKLRLIKFLFYKDPIYMGRMFDILQNKGREYPNDSIKERTLKILINLTHWADSSTFTKPLVELNIYQYVFNMMEVEKSRAINKLIVDLILNLVLLDPEITFRGYEDNIIQKLVGDITHRESSIDVSAHLSCIGNYILRLDLKTVDIRDQIDLNSSLIPLVADASIDEDSLLVFLSAVRWMISQYSILLESNTVKELEEMYYAWKNREVGREIEMILHLCQQ